MVAYQIGKLPVGFQGTYKEARRSEVWAQSWCASCTSVMSEELRQFVRKEIGAIASPDAIQFAPALPKTRSGKIMRRILRKIAEGEPDMVGDISTLAEPAVVDALIEGSQT